MKKWRLIAGVALVFLLGVLDLVLRGTRFYHRDWWSEPFREGLLRKKDCVPEEVDERPWLDPKRSRRSSRALLKRRIRSWRRSVWRDDLRSRQFLMRASLA